MEEEQLVDNEDSGSSSTIWESCKKFVSAITIEPAVFCLVFSYGVLINVTPTLLLDRCCRADYGYSQDICDNLKEHENELKECQIWSNQINVYKQLLQSIPSAIIALFAGAWTDKYGRKPAILVPLFFNVLEYIFYLVFSLYEQLSDKWYILSAVYGLGGGLPLFLAATFSYITDISSVEQRNLRVSLIDGSLFIGLPLGSIFSGMMLKKIGYVGIFSISIAFMATSFIYVLFRINDSRSNLSVETEGSSGLTSILKETYRAVFKKRPERTASFLLMISMFLYVSCNGINVYYYTIVMYQWSEEMYSYFFSVFVFVDGIFSYIVYPFFMHKVHASDPTLGIVGELVSFVKSLILVYSFNTNIFIIGYIFGVIGSYTGVVIRSTISKISPKENIGKIFAVIGFLEALVPMVSSAVFTYIYNNTVDIYPGWIFMALASIHSIILILLMVVHAIFSKSSNQSWLVEFYNK
ncbi:probable peptidoglycan muropeptide transporter SLC46 isoform X1 [Lepeophtheirus salmonis]|uniref:probable peptidoglycan muropeptide transporter SLC46 isoform X1 n=1 Tax=Lepeophtheirus salmonis TaxID=72036 RepID=UPI001AE6F7CC|nr:proton-coupled folate transporter-like isoform X1 [Lepeophtheirus salmonis]XP_040574058.1 proton-coupled folate transporter-like isoform X1 [Lepeophtheirus salmonis]